MVGSTAASRCDESMWSKAEDKQAVPGQFQPDPVRQTPSTTSNDIHPPTTDVTDYSMGLEKLSAYGQVFPSA